jgi:hypothetical protein
MPAALEDIHNDRRADEHQETEDADEEVIEEDPADYRDDSPGERDHFACPEFAEESVNFFPERG